MSWPQSVPRLTRDDVTLRAHHLDDVPAVVEQCLDPLSRQWTTVPLGYTNDDAKRFVNHAIPGGWNQDAEWAFAVEAGDDEGRPRFAGTVSLRDRGDGRAEIAYGAHPWVRGRGAMETALRLLLEWGFAERELRMVVWWANRGNWASRRLAWKLGFSFDGTVRGWLPQRGELRDGWVGSLLAGEPLSPRTPWLESPTIHGERVVLRALRGTDVPRIVEGCRDPESRAWLGVLPHPYEERHALEFLEERRDRQAEGTVVTWAMADPASDVLTGLVNIFDIAAGDDGEIGYWTHPANRGLGVATEACRLVARHAFIPEPDGGLGLRSVRALAAVGNDASQRVLAKAGLTEVGRSRRRCTVQNGVKADAVCFDMLAEELTLD